MNKLISVFDKLQYLGLLGLPMFFSDALIWPWFWLFWFFGIVNIILTWPVFIQSLKQIFLAPITYCTHRFSLPTVGNTRNKCKYILPFKEGWTAINGGPDKASSHSWGILSQRYAYDFVILDAEGKSYTGDNAKLGSYYCYGKEIVAPADGMVVDYKENLKDSLELGKGKVDATAKDIRGNYIIIKHSSKEYSCLAHLQPGSLKVQKGQWVKQGEVVAYCGNSGNTTEPHLHFQLQDGPSFFLAAGLPVQFENIQKSRNPQYACFDSRESIAVNPNYIVRGDSIRAL